MNELSLHKIIITLFNVNGNWDELNLTANPWVMQEVLNNPEQA